MQQTLLIELRTEELPPKVLNNLGESFSRVIFDELAKLGFVSSGTEYQAFASPRRLAVRIPDVAAVQPEQQAERKGPAVSAGIYGWPMEDAARIAVSTVRAVLSSGVGSVELVRFVLFSDDALAAFRAAAGE